MDLRDILSPNLHGESRIATSTPILRRVFTNAMYDIFIALYPERLVTTIVHYKRENLRIMSRLDLPLRSSEVPTAATPNLVDPMVALALETLKGTRRGPFHLIRDAKLECRITLTLHDRAALKIAGIEIPKSAGRFREMFLNS